MLRWRLLLGTLIIGLLVALGWADARAATPGVWLLPVLMIFTVLGTGESLRLARAAGLNPLAWPVYVANLLIVLGQWVPFVFRWTPGREMTLMLAWPLAGLSLGVLLIFLGEMARYRKPGGVLPNLAASVLAVVYVGVMLGMAAQIRLFGSIGFLVAWIAAVKMSDTGAYTVGRLIGRHKLCSTLSPGKTIEGAVGALAFSCFAAWLCSRWLAPPIYLNWAWLPFGLLMGVGGILGDLAESLLKRDVGCKDSSSWLPGFGGVLDILDSLLLTAPVAWIWMQVVSSQ